MHDSISLNGQLQLLAALERAGGSLSLVSVLVVLVSYTFIRRLRTGPNTFLVFTSITAALGSIACLIGDEGVRQGASSRFCLTQEFLLDAFALSGPLWSLTLAVHLLVIFSKSPRPGYLQRWGWVYCLVCYGAPLGLALVHLQVTQFKGAMPDVNAEGWCWESVGLKMLHIYVPVWGCLLASSIIYVGVAVHLFRNQHEREQGWADCNSARWSSNHLIIEPSRERDSITSLSDWPISPRSGQIFFGAQSAEAKPRARPRPVTYPPPAHAPPIPPRSWLRDFALAPRPAPSPPPRKRFSVGELARYFFTEDSVRRRYLWIGLMFVGSLLFTWLPGTISLIWKLAHAELDAPFGFRVAVATVFPLQGVWIGVIFSITNWKELRKGVPARSEPCSRINGLLEEPLTRLRGDAVSTGETDTEKAKPEPRASRTWHRRTRSDDWDFVDIGIPSRVNTVVRARPRANSEPVLSPLLPTPSLGRNF